MKQFAFVFTIFLASLGVMGMPHTDDPTETSSTKSLKRADKAFSQFEFLEAIEYYKAAHASEPDNIFISRRIGECYRKLGLMDEAVYWYKRTVEHPEVEANDLYYYARVLTGKGEYGEARLWYNRYHDLKPEDNRVIDVLDSETYFEDLLAMNPANEVRNLALNNDKPTLCAIPFEEGILFSAVGLEQREEMEDQEVYWEFNQYLDMFYAEVDNEGRITEPRSVPELNTLYNDGPSAYDPKTRTLYVTQNQVKRAKPLADKSGNVQLKIVMFKYENDEWIEAGEFPHNSTEYSVAHPSISRNGEYLFFSSNMQGGFGQTDIYRCQRQGDSWGAPENLGPNVNTPDNEVFPFEAGGNVLYFSSDGYPGLGGLDVFRSYHFDDAWTSPENMGVPINSATDDFGLTFVKAASGFFSSNRKGRGLDDDIFWFDLLSRRKFFQIAMSELGNMDGVAQESMILRNLDTGEEMKLNSDSVGVSMFEAIEEFSYELSWDGEDKKNRILFLNNEQEVTGRVTQMGEYAVQPDVENDVALDVRLTDKLKSTSNDLEKLLDDFSVYNVTDNRLYVNETIDAPSWMDEYAINGQFDYSQGLSDMAGRDITIKDRDTGQLMDITVNEDGTVSFPINPNHAYDVFWTRDGKTYIHTLRPSGDYYEVDNTFAQNSVLDVELINFEAERLATLALSMVEFEATPLEDDQIKVLNRTDGSVAQYDLNKKGVAQIPNDSKYGFDIYWMQDGTESHHALLPAAEGSEEKWEILNEEAPDRMLVAGDGSSGQLNLSMTSMSMVDYCADQIEEGQIYVYNRKRAAGSSHMPTQGVLRIALDHSADYLVIWKEGETVNSYNLSHPIDRDNWTVELLEETQMALTTREEGEDTVLSLSDMETAANKSGAPGTDEIDANLLASMDDAAMAAFLSQALNEGEVYVFDRNTNTGMRHKATGGNVSVALDVSSEYFVVWKTDTSTESFRLARDADGASWNSEALPDTAMDLITQNAQDETVLSLSERSAINPRNANATDLAIDAGLLSGMDADKMADYLSDRLSDGGVYVLDANSTTGTSNASVNGEISVALDESKEYTVFWKEGDFVNSYVVSHAAGAQQWTANPTGATSLPLGVRTDGENTVLALGEANKAKVTAAVRPALSFDMVYFDYNQSVVRNTDMSLLEEAVAVLEQHPEATLEIIGHTDIRGSNGYNDKLSRKRAENVKRYLVRQGIPAHRLSTAARGENTLAVKCKEEECSEQQHQQNRRAELKLVLPEE